jgi:hypothetical protein
VARGPHRRGIRALVAHALPAAFAVLAAGIVVAAPSLHALMEQAVRLLP